MNDDITYYGKKKQTQVTLRALMETGIGKRLSEFFKHAEKVPPGFSVASDRVKIQIACFLHRELPIRLAHRALALEKIKEVRSAQCAGERAVCGCLLSAIGSLMSAGFLLDGD